MVYTKHYSGEFPGNFYGSRFGTEPYFSENIDDPADTWNQWSTGGASNTLRFFESTANASGANFGTYTDPDWDTFIADNSLETAVSRASQAILFFSVQTGSAWADGFTGQVDGLRIELTDGSVAMVNFEAEDHVAASADACKKGGWETLTRADFSTFKNQGDCIQYVNTGK